jgi:hypothetical protein
VKISPEISNPCFLDPEFLALSSYRSCQAVSPIPQPSRCGYPALGTGDQFGEIGNLSIQGQLFLQRALSLKVKTLAVQAKPGDMQ